MCTALYVCVWHLCIAVDLQHYSSVLALMPLYFVYLLCCFLCTLQVDLFSYDSIDQLYVDLLELYGHGNGKVANIDDGGDTAWENLLEEIEVVQPVTVRIITVETVTDKTVIVVTVTADVNCICDFACLT
jgi:hypothetical protein